MPQFQRPMPRRPVALPPKTPGFAYPGQFAATCTNMPLPPEAMGTVKGLQMFLNQRGLGPLRVDGICGVQTFQAWQKYDAAKLKMGTNQTQPSNPPSGPPPPVLMLPPPTVLAPLPVPPPEPVPLWKQPIVIAAAAIIFVLILTRK